MKKTILALALLSIAASANVNFFIGTATGTKTDAISEMKKYNKTYESTKGTNTRVVKKYTKWRVEVLGVKSQKQAKEIIKDLNLKNVFWKNK